MCTSLQKTKSNESVRIPLHAFNLAGPHFFQFTLVDNGKTADILSDGAGSHSSAAAIERFCSPFHSSMGYLASITLRGWFSKEDHEAAAMLHIWTIITGMTRARRLRVERPNVPLIGVCSFKALSCRVSCCGVLSIWPLPLFRLGNSTWLDDFGFPSSGNLWCHNSTAD